MNKELGERVEEVVVGYFKEFVCCYSSKENI
jgi:hypothetical protein